MKLLGVEIDYSWVPNNRGVLSSNKRGWGWGVGTLGKIKYAGDRVGISRGRGVVNCDEIKGKGLFVNMSTTTIIIKLKII